MTAIHPPDTQHQGFLALLPAGVRRYALLARFDRPIGWWLLYWPCAWGLALGGGERGHWSLFFWLLLGAIAMRGVGRSDESRGGRRRVGWYDCVCAVYQLNNKNNTFD